MTLEQAQQYLPVIPRFSPAVTFTGGEPLLYLREIVELTRQARALGLRVRLVTGTGWVKDEMTARRRVQGLADAGLEKIGISWDIYHEEFARREQALVLARSAIEAGLKVRVRTVITANGQADDCWASFQDLPVEFETIPLIRLGRATTLPLEHFRWYEVPPQGPCKAVLKPAIEPDGMVYACCGPAHFSHSSSPLVLGNTEDEPLEDILLRAVNDPLLEVIYLLGPYGLYHLLKNHPTGRKRFKTRSRYTGICDLCLDINNSPELVMAVRERLQDPDAKALVVAAKMRMESGLSQ